MGKWKIEWKMKNENEKLKIGKWGNGKSNGNEK